MKSGVEKMPLFEGKVKILEAKMSSAAAFKAKPRKRKIILKNIHRWEDEED